MLDKVKSKPAEIAAEQDIAALRADIEALKSDLKSLFVDGTEVAKAKASEKLKTGEEALQSIKGDAKELQGTLEDKIRENPLTACGVALGAGFLVAMFRGR